MEGRAEAPKHRDAGSGGQWADPVLQEPPHDGHGRGGGGIGGCHDGFRGHVASGGGGPSGNAGLWSGLPSDDGRLGPGAWSPHDGGPDGGHEVTLANMMIDGDPDIVFQHERKYA